MTWLESLLLGIIQGLTEFLPVSSSGHLQIGRELLGIPFTDDLTMEVTLHAATVCATIVVLWREIVTLFRGFFKFRYNDETRYVLKILVSMIPVMVVGLFFKDQVEALFGNGLDVVGCALLGTAALLALSYYARPRVRTEISYFHAFLIGIGQAIAVIPGLSRSGTTIATGIILGNKKETVARFSFLMVIIPILGEAFLEVLDMASAASPASSTGLLPLIVGFAAAFVTGYFACRWMIDLVKRGKLIWFALYCAVVGTVTLIFA